MAWRFHSLVWVTNDWLGEWQSEELIKKFTSKIDETHLLKVCYFLLIIKLKITFIFFYHINFYQSDKGEMGPVP